jgi:hypothetical protein
MVPRVTFIAAAALMWFLPIVIAQSDLSGSTDGWRRDVVMNNSPNGGWVGNITAEEVREAWDGQLRPVAADLISPDIAPSTRQFLTEVGLPTWGYSELITFLPDERLLRSVTVASVEYHMLAEEAGRPVAVKAHTDEVWALDPTGRSRQRFVNTHPAFLVLFLGILLPLIDQLRNREPAEVNARLDEVAARFAAHDAAALADPDSWWPSVLEVAREGYL